MNIQDVLVEGAVAIFGKRGNKMVRKYRCTTGQKKGRIVAKPQTCNTAVKVGKSVGAKKAKSRKSALMKIRSGITRKTSAASKRVAKLNKSRLKPTKRNKTRRMK